MEITAKSLTSGRLLARNTVWNLVGNASPILFAFYATPLLIKGLGTDRFGMLILVWGVIGYFSLFDLGMGMAMTKIVADLLGLGREEELPGLVWTGLLAMLALGVTGAAFTCLIAPAFVGHILKVPPNLRPEAVEAAYMLAFAIPLVVLTAGLRGLLAARQLFKILSIIRIPMGAVTFLVPLVVLPFSKSLFWVSAALVAGRAVTFIVHLVVCLCVYPSLRRIKPDKKKIKPLLALGGWLTVSNIVSPIMGYADRFILGAMVSVTAVAYYATPFDMITKILMVPDALAEVLFPAFATSFISDRGRTGRIFWQSVRYIFYMVFPLTLAAAVFAHKGLEMWIGPEFANRGAPIMQWLAAGVLVNCLAQIPFALIQGIGRPDLTAKFHLLETPFYIAAIWLLVKHYGVTGMAMAWTTRACLDAFLLFMVAHRSTRPEAGDAAPSLLDARTARN